MHWMKRSALVLTSALALWFSAPQPAKADGVCWANGVTPIAGLTLTYPSCNASGYLNVNIASGGGSIVFSLPYNGTNGQTITTASFLGVGGLDANGKFSPLQEDSSQNLLDKEVNSGTIATQTTNAASSLSSLVTNLGTQAYSSGDLRVKINSGSIANTAFGITGVTTGGQQTKANSLSVTIASDQGALSTTDTNGSSIATNTSNTNTSVQALQATHYAVVSGNGNTVVKGSAGRFFGVLITVTYATTALTCFDNASTNSGNQIFSGAVTSGPSTSIDAVPAGGIPVTNGITCNQGSTGSAIVAYS